MSSASTSLDKRLEELLHDYKYQVEMNRDVYARLGNDEYLSILDTAIEAIKQAFIDEGWLKFPQSFQESKLMDAKEVRLPGLVWYARFLAAYRQAPYKCNCHPLAEDNAAHQAARRAAGVDE